jgi:hypothetical protein
MVNGSDATEPPGLVVVPGVTGRDIILCRAVERDARTPWRRDVSRRLLGVQAATLPYCDREEQSNGRIQTCWSVSSPLVCER